MIAGLAQWVRKTTTPVPASDGNTLTLPRSGHHPSHRRRAFEELVSRLLQTDDETATHAGLYALSGVLWNCTDTMPRSLCDDVAVLCYKAGYRWRSGGGQTYAQGARVIRDWLRAQSEKRKLIEDAQRATLRRIASR